MSENTCSASVRGFHAYEYRYMERTVLLKDLKFYLDTDQKSNFVKLSK